MTASGPLAGVRVVELAGLGPVPFCGMLLADYGADAIRVERVRARSGAPAEREPALDPPLYGEPSTENRELCNRSRPSIALDLKNADGLATALELVDRADVLIEGFRPGVTERLGLGPETCLERNPRLVYGRMTGWGRTGPYASSAGHDINYIALSGSLHPIGRGDEIPVPPLNLLGDFGGGGMLLALGVCAALVEVGRSGLGQVVDAAMVDGSALLATMIHGFVARGAWSDHDRAANPPPGLSSHFYEVFETLDHKWVTIGAIEPQFYAELLRLMGLGDDERFKRQLDRSSWPELKQLLASIFSSKTRREWCELLEGTDGCFAPVLSLEEAPAHPHNLSRQTFVEVEGVVQPAPAPRFSRTPAAIQCPPDVPGSHSTEVLRRWGVSQQRVDALKASGALT